MIGQAIWWACIVLEALVLMRGLQGRLLSRYPVFYSYMLFVLLQSLLRFSVYHSRPRLYLGTYWITEWMGILIGCGVVFEIYRVGLSAYPGTARLARNLLAFVFVLAFTKAIVETSNNPHWWSTATTIDLERVLRAVQTVAIIGLIVLFLSYKISFGRNLRGILLGYGLFVAVSVFQLTFVTNTTSRFHQLWSYASPGSYLIILALWAVHLWVYLPNPEPRKAVQLEEQYQRVAAATSRRLREARGYLVRAVRP